MPPLPHWDADGSQLRSNLDQLSARIEHDAARRVMPTLADAKQWHRQMMEGLAVDDVKMVGHFRGEPGLEKVDVHVDGVYGSAPALVAGEVNAFEAALRQRLAALPPGTKL